MAKRTQICGGRGVEPRTETSWPIRNRRRIARRRKVKGLSSERKASWKNKENQVDAGDDDDVVVDIAKRNNPQATRLDKIRMRSRLVGTNKNHVGSLRIAGSIDGT